MSIKKDLLVKELLDAVVLIEDQKEAWKFLRDLLTKKELEELARRWKAARLLSEGVSYSEIQEVTGLSSTTIARVATWLKNGEGGYRMMIKRWINEKK